MEDLIIKVLTYLGTFVTGLVTLLPKLKQKNSFIKINKREAEVLAAIPELMLKAEKIYGSGHGIQKLDYVLTQLKLKAYENFFQLNEEKATQEIEALVTTTKVVNSANTVK